MVLNVSIIAYDMSIRKQEMFNSPEQAVNFCASLIHYNRYCGEYVVLVAFYCEKIASFF
jgi:hypothetical protein